MSTSFPPKPALTRRGSNLFSCEPQTHPERQFNCPSLLASCAVNWELADELMGRRTGCGERARSGAITPTSGASDSCGQQHRPAVDMHRMHSAASWVPCFLSSAEDAVPCLHGFDRGGPLCLCGCRCAPCYIPSHRLSKVAPQCRLLPPLLLHQVLAVACTLQHYLHTCRCCVVVARLPAALSDTR